jgi:hypothetical protein
MIDLIKKASMEAFDAAGPVALLFATVTEAAPLAVRVDQRFLLTEDFLIVPERLTAQTIVSGGVELQIARALEKDDKVLLLRMQGGQKYVILDRVVEE